MAQVVKSARTSPVPTKKKKKGKDLLAIKVTDKDLSKSIPATLGYAVQSSRSLRGHSTHATAHLSRCMYRASVIQEATNCRALLAPEPVTVVAAFPSDYELSLQQKLKLTFYRDKLYPGDIIRNFSSEARGIHVPVVSPGSKIVISMSDCPMADLGKMFDHFDDSGCHGFELLFVIGGTSLGGKIGIDRLKNKPGKVWFKDDTDTVHTLALGCITQYSDRVDRPWLDKSQGMLREWPTPLYFICIPLKTIGTAAFVVKILVTRTPYEDKYHGFPISERGVLINDVGLVPALFGVNWARELSPHATSEFTSRFKANEIIKSAFGNLEFLADLTPRNSDGGDFDNLQRLLNEATIHTINFCVTRGSPQLILPPRSYASEAVRLAAVARHSDIPIPRAFAASMERGPLPEIILNTFKGLIEDIKEMFRTLKRMYDEYQAEKKAKEALKDNLMENPIGFFAWNAVWNVGKALGRLSKKISPEGTTLARKLRQGLGRVSNIMTRSFEVEADDTILTKFIKLIAVAGTVVMERFITHYGGRIGTLILVATEVSSILIQQGARVDVMNVIERVSYCTIGHVILSLAPWYISVPCHLAVDLWASRVVHRFRMLWQMLGWEGVKNDLRATFNGGFHSLRHGRRARDLVYDAGEVFDDQLEPFQTMSGTSVPHPEALPLLEMETLSYDGAPLTMSGFAQLAPEETKPSYRQATALVKIPELNKFRTTRSDTKTALHALNNRFATIEQGPKLEGTFFRAGMKAFINWTGERYVTPLTDEEFEEHMEASDWPFQKRRAYRKATLDLKKGIAKRVAVPFCAKAAELIKVKMKNGKLVFKTRLTHNLKPDDHVPWINWALAYKKHWATFLHQYVGTVNRDPSKHYVYYRPKKGTTSEMTSFLNLHRDKIVVVLSGDDNYVRLFWKGKKTLTLALDLRSCDTTIQKPTLAVILDLFEKSQPPTGFKDYFEIVNYGPRSLKVWINGVEHALKYSNPYGMNTSGVCTTTQTTDFVSFSLWEQVFQTWNGDVNTLVRTITECATNQGRKLEFETYPSTHENTGLTPIGCCSILAYVPVIGDCGQIKVTNRSYTKSFVTKGRSSVARGFDLDFSIAQRACDTKLNCSPYGQAIKHMYECWAMKHPAPASRKVIEPWKLSFDSEPLTLAEEFAYIQRVCPGITIEDYEAELNILRTNDTFPMPVSKGSMRIASALANLHYGLGD